MKEIVLFFKTEKGEKAYHQVDAEGKAQSFMDRKISRAVAKDSIVATNPLTVKIRIKVERLAIQIQLDEQIVTALKKYGAVRDTDYTMKVN